MIDTAMVLAAGFGTRMRPITEHIPKPLIELAGRSLIDRVIDRLAEAGVGRVVVNTHYKAEAMAAHLAARRDVEIRLSHEPELRDTGGGIRQALPLLGDAFYTINADIVWLDGKLAALTRLARAWEGLAQSGRRRDAVLLLQRTTTALGYDGLGDFIVDQSGTIRRRQEREVAPHLYAGIQVLSRAVFESAPEGKFSLNPLWDRAIAADRIGGIVHDGEWYHVGTPQGLASAEERLAYHATQR